MAIAFGLLEDISSGFEGVYAFFYSGHDFKLRVDEVTAAVFVVNGESTHAVFVELAATRRLGIEMVFTRLASQNLPGAGDFESFQI